MRTVDFDSRDHYHHTAYPSPFHSRQAQHNQLKEWGRWADYQSVPAYWCEDMEYFAGRNACGVFDLTPMVKHRFTGPDALACLNRMVTRDVAKIRPGRVGYTVWCNEQGQVLEAQVEITRGASGWFQGRGACRPATSATTMASWGR